MRGNTGFTQIIIIVIVIIIIIIIIRTGSKMEPRPLAEKFRSPQG